MRAKCLVLALGLAVASCSYLGPHDGPTQAQAQPQPATGGPVGPQIAPPESIPVPMPAPVPAPAPKPAPAPPPSPAASPAPSPAPVATSADTKAEGSTSVTVTPELEAAIAEALKPRLKRPETALYRTITAFDTQDGRIVACGLVNAKAASGAYVGYTLFRANLAVLRPANGKATYQPVASVLARDPESFFAANPLCKPLG